MSTTGRKPSGKRRRQSEFTPTFVVWYKPWSRPELSFRAFYKRIFRMPTLNDLYYTFIGNKYLKPGIHHPIQPRRHLCEKFRRRPAADRLPGGRLLQRSGRQDRRHAHQQPVPVDDDQPRSRGNTRDRNDRADRLAVRSGNLQRPAELHLPESPGRHRPTSEWYGGQIPYIPWHSGSAVLNLGYRGWDLNYSFYTGERYESVANIPENYARPWYTHDMALSKYIPFKNGAAHHRRSEQHLQPAIRSRTMLPDAGHEFLKSKINFTL